MAGLGGDIGARDATAAEVASEFGNKSLGHYDTDHVMKIPKGIAEILALERRTVVDAVGQPKLTFAQTEVFRKQVADWKIRPGSDGVERLRREWTCVDAASATKMRGMIESAAKDAGKTIHISADTPDTLRVETHTPEVGGLHENDFIIAAIVDKLDGAALMKKNVKKQQFWV